MGLFGRKKAQLSERSRLQFASTIALERALERTSGTKGIISRYIIVRLTNLRELMSDVSSCATYFRKRPPLSDVILYYLESLHFLRYRRITRR